MSWLRGTDVQHAPADSGGGGAGGPPELVKYTWTSAAKPSGFDASAESNKEISTGKVSTRGIVVFAKMTINGGGDSNTAYLYLATSDFATKLAVLTNSSGQFPWEGPSTAMGERTVYGTPVQTDGAGKLYIKTRNGNSTIDTAYNVEVVVMWLGAETTVAV